MSPCVAKTDPSTSTTAPEAFGASHEAIWSSAPMLRFGAVGSGFAVDELGEAEGEVEALATVQPRVADRLVPIVEVVIGHRIGTPETLGHVVSRELDVDAAGPCALGPVCPHEP